jgi:hypothetical protein
MGTVDDATIEQFATREAAETWMAEIVDDSCQDNNRFAFLDDLEAMLEYQSTKDSGCCGSFDAPIEVAGRKATIGCNYGH